MFLSKCTHICTKILATLLLSGTVRQSIELTRLSSIPEISGVEAGTPVRNRWWLGEGTHKEMGTPVKIV